jgi:hypothetical protein
VDIAPCCQKTVTYCAARSMVWRNSTATHKMWQYCIIHHPRHVGIVIQSVQRAVQCSWFYVQHPSCHTDAEISGGGGGMVIKIAAC